MAIIRVKTEYRKATVGSVSAITFLYFICMKDSKYKIDNFVIYGGKYHV